MYQGVFAPNTTKTKSISVTASGQSVTLDATDVSSTPTPLGSGPSGGHSVMQIVNLGPNKAFVRWGKGAQTAAVTDMPILNGTTQVFDKAADADTVGAICASTETATLYITCGEGV